ncbi:MAG: hypothetical protein K2K00_03460 [Muribaculaceae bacterium]|nr:hypothetical protein [Muribaculaceae bacterium]MDE6702716.1 hypothetical protein [Muribaculaceae bacterium]
MKKILATITGICISLAAMATSDYATTAAKAQRFFDAREWASAQALYGLMLDQKPDADSVYVRAIVASSMLGHKQTASHFLTDAMKAGVSFSRLMGGVKTVAFEVGAPSVYEDFLLRSQKDCPWLKRAIDDELLNYYMFRNNGALTVEYAQKMLSGLPDSIEYLSDLAEGYIALGDGDKAADTWKRILSLDPDNYQTLLKLGNYCDVTGDWLGATDYLQRAAQIRLTPYVAKRLAMLDTVEKKH